MNASANTIFGSDVDTRELVGISRAGRRQGVYLIGANGTGKSTLLERMVVADIDQGIGTLVLDIHGRLVNSILAQLPPERASNCFYLDMTDPNWSFGLNLFECADPSQASVVADQAVTLFRKIWADSWGQTLQAILFNTAYVFATHGGMTLAEVPRFLRDDAFRERVSACLPADHPVRDFWEYDYRTTTDRGSTIRRVQEFLSSDTLYRVVAQEKSTIPLREVMDLGLTLLVKLDPKQERASELVGALLLSNVFEAALSRLEDMSEAECYAHQFHLYCDEYDRFCSPQFAQMMREVRKCGLGITIAHQDRDKLDSANRAATMQLGTQIAFRVGVDASELARYFPRPTELGEPVQKRKMQPVYKTWTTVRWGQSGDEERYQATGRRVEAIEKETAELRIAQEKARDALGIADRAWVLSLSSIVSRSSLIDYIRSHAKPERSWCGPPRNHETLYRIDMTRPHDIPLELSTPQAMVQTQAGYIESLAQRYALSPADIAELKEILVSIFAQYRGRVIFHYRDDPYNMGPLSGKPVNDVQLHYAVEPDEVRWQYATSKFWVRDGEGTKVFLSDTRHSNYEPETLPPPTPASLVPLRRFAERISRRFSREVALLENLEVERQGLLAVREQLLAAKVTETQQEYLGETPVVGYDPASGRSNAPLYEMVREPRQLTQAEFAQRLSSLPDHTAWAKLVTGSVHRIQTLPLRPLTDVDRADITARSRERFCRTRRQIQVERSQRLGDGAGTHLTEHDAPAPTKRVRKREPLAHDAN